MKRKATHEIRINIIAYLSTCTFVFLCILFGLPTLSAFAVSGVAKIQGGTWHTMAIKSDGTLWTWGHNNHGQLGDGTTGGRHLPVQVGTDNDWISVAGSSHSVALKSDGTLWAWGWGIYGQLGNGMTINRLYPVQIGTDTDWILV